MPPSCLFILAEIPGQELLCSQDKVTVLLLASHRNVHYYNCTQVIPVLLLPYQDENEHGEDTENLSDRGIISPAKLQEASHGVSLITLSAHFMTEP